MTAASSRKKHGEKEEKKKENKRPKVPVPKDLHQDKGASATHT